MKINGACANKIKDDFRRANLGTSDLELLYDNNTDVEVLREKPSVIVEYPKENEFPPYWKKFAELCQKTGWEKNLGNLFSKFIYNIF